LEERHGGVYEKAMAFTDARHTHGAGLDDQHLFGTDITKESLTFTLQSTRKAAERFAPSLIRG